MYPKDVKPLLEALKGHRTDMTGFWIDEMDYLIKFERDLWSYNPVFRNL